MLAQKLNMERNQAERWIVDLIRNAQLDAKIDSENVNPFFPFLKKLFSKKKLFF